ncbi:hypothetical protein [Streptomyces sp. NPDC018036]|uniref:hypothetical protein n=1 Tax=Streptomyces sp. NPDC018036 TaxID=3365035 RepID=UPI0037BA16C6
MQFKTSLPADSESLELVEQGEGLLHDAAELAKALDVRGALAGDHRHDAPALQLAPHSSESYALSPRTDSGRRRGRPGRPATDGMPSIKLNVW